MTDEGKQEPKAEGLSVEDLQSQIKEMSKRVTKYEEDLAYSKRENEKLKTAKDERDKMVQDKANAGDPDAAKKLREELRNEFVSELEKERAEKTKISQELKQERVIKSGLTIAADIFNSDALEFIESKISKFCDYEDGEIVVKDEKGQIRYSENNRREPMKVDEYIKELADKYPTFAKATAQSGGQTGGTKVNGTSRRGITVEQYNRMSREEQSKISAEDAEVVLKQLAFR